jgi:Xaa-Pro aminopeptidase
MKPDFARRIKALRKAMAEKGLDVIMTSSQDEILYYTGYRGLRDDRLFMLFPLNGRPKLIVSSLSNEAKKFYPEIVYMKEFKDVLACMKPYKTIGYDERVIDIMVFHEIKKLKPGIRPATSLLEAQRIVKDAYEITQLKKAAQATGKAMSAVSGKLAGRTEKQIADALEIEYRKLGAESAYEPLVCAGKNTQFIHHAAGPKVIAKNDVVMIDAGARVNGYCCDVTRMFFRKINAKHRQMYEDVKQIKSELTSRIRAGVSYKEIENLYRSLLAQKGYKVFHSFGHGVGLSVHEPAGEVLQENAVITVEPGVYIKNFGGVRIEDTIVVKKGKADVLSRSIRLL